MSADAKIEALAADLNDIVGLPEDKAREAAEYAVRWAYDALVAKYKGEGVWILVRDWAEYDESSTEILGVYSQEPDVVDAMEYELLGPNQWLSVYHAEVGNSNVNLVFERKYVEPPPRVNVPEKLEPSHTITFEQTADGTITVDKMDLYVTGAPYTVEHNVTPGKELESTIKFDHSETIGRLEKGCE